MATYLLLLPLLLMRIRYEPQATGAICCTWFATLLTVTRRAFVIKDKGHGNSSNPLKSKYWRVRQLMTLH